MDANYGVLAIFRRLRYFQPLVFTGSLSLQDKDTLIRKFKTDRGRRVTNLSLQAGGEGLNLQKASYIFNFDRWWNPAVEHHAEDRAHRQGQSSPAHVLQVYLRKYHRREN